MLKDLINMRARTSWMLGGAAVLMGLLFVSLQIGTSRADVASLDPNAHPPMVAAVQSDQASTFGLLKRPTTNADRMPDSLRDALAGPQRFGRNADLARAIRSEAGTAWVIPADRSICLVSPDPEGGYGTTCTPADVAEAQGMSALTATSRNPTVGHLTLLLPDDASAALRLSDGSSRELSPDADGVVSGPVPLQAGNAIVISKDGKAVTSNLPVPPPSVPTAGPDQR